MRLFVLLVMSVMLSSCAANAFTTFYTDQTGGANLAALDNVILSDTEPKVFSGGDWEKDSRAMMQRGYMLVGYSSYNGATGTVDQVRSQAKRVLADTAIFYSSYTNTVSGVVPLTLPDTQTSNTSIYGNVYGSGDSATFTGNATTTTTGTKTTYIPYNTRRYDYSATYWVKMKPLSFGVYGEDLSVEQRKQIGSNKGAVLTVIVNESPAFMADFLPGDILIRLNDTEITNLATLLARISENKGRRIVIDLIRDGELLRKDVTLN